MSEPPCSPYKNYVRDRYILQSIIEGGIMYNGRNKGIMEGVSYKVTRQDDGVGCT